VPVATSSTPIASTTTSYVPVATSSTPIAGTTTSYVHVATSSSAPVSPKSGLSSGAIGGIVGSVLGGLVVILIAVFLLFFRRKYRRQQEPRPLLEIRQVPHDCNEPPVGAPMNDDTSEEMPSAALGRVSNVEKCA
jgi:Trk-type K+ transport system membrane component